MENQEKLREELKRKYNLSEEDIENLEKLEAEIAEAMLNLGMTYGQAEEYIESAKEEYFSHHYY